MREIKFRAWDKEEARMIKWSELHLDTDQDGMFIWIGETDNFGTAEGYPLGDFELMQYTGLKDDCNNEIYEGDILYFEDESEFIGYVYFQDGCFYVSGVSELLYEWNKACRVEGNIYEDVERYKQL